LDAARERILGGLAVAAASTWGTLGLFAKILYAQGVSFESLVAVRASVGWLAVVGFLLMLSVVHTALAFALYTFGIRHLGAGRAAIVATIEPVVAGVLGVTLLHEELTALKALGASLVLAGAGRASKGSPAETRLIRQIR
jgi:drug/metabolite transporter (DMT)-like permease